MLSLSRSRGLIPQSSSLSRPTAVSSPPAAAVSVRSTTVTLLAGVGSGGGGSGGGSPATARGNASKKRYRGAVHDHDNDHKRTKETKRVRGDDAIAIAVARPDSPVIVSQPTDGRFTAFSSSRGREKHHGNARKKRYRGAAHDHDNDHKRTTETKRVRGDDGIPIAAAGPASPVIVPQPTDGRFTSSSSYRERDQHHGNASCWFCPEDWQGIRGRSHRHR